MADLVPDAITHDTMNILSCHALWSKRPQIVQPRDLQVQSSILLNYFNVLHLLILLLPRLDASILGCLLVLQTVTNPIVSCAVAFCCHGACPKLLPLRQGSSWLK